MAVNDPNYRYATQTWEADGVRTQYEIAFDGGYIRQSDVVAFSVLVDDETGLVSDRTVHELTFLAEDVDEESGWKTATVQITPAVPVGRRVVIFRSTDKSTPLVNYNGGSALTEKNLDLANRQAIFGIAEIMDGLNAAAIAIDQQVQEVIDMNALIGVIYTQVLELLASGGIVSVSPRVWSATGNGEDTDFPLVGADVDGSGFYDTYVDGVGLEPGVDYTIIMGETPEDTLIRFTTAPGLGVRWFTVLRGYARPYTGPEPVTTLRPPVIDVPDSVYYVDKDSEYALLRALSNTTATFYVKPIPEVGTTETVMQDGSYVSIVQRGTAQVVVEPETVDVTLIVPAGFLPRTRAAGSVISLTCEYADGNSWIVSGDLAPEE